MLDRAVKMWRWLNTGAELGHTPSLASVSEHMTAGEHYAALVLRVLFVVSEIALIGVGFISIPLFMFIYMTVLGLPTPFEFIAAIVTPAVLWLFLRKLHALLRTAAFDAVGRRASRRAGRDEPRVNVALDAAGTGGSPVAVSVDVDHDEPVRRA